MSSTPIVRGHRDTDLTPSHLKDNGVESRELIENPALFRCRPGNYLGGSDRSPDLNLDFFLPGEQLSEIRAV